MTDEIPRNAQGERVRVATVASQRKAKRLERAAERKRLEEAAARGIRCACMMSRLRLARAPHAALVCDGCGAWYEDGQVTMRKGKKR